MAEYAFPAQLLEELHAHWRPPHSSTSSALPDDLTLLRLLETCYHASLRTAELRATRCVLAYVSTDSLSNRSLLRFEHPAILTASELVRLAPVTELHRTLIGCHHFGGMLKIWGLFEHGQAWQTVDSISGTTTREEDLPDDCLTITIEGPGALSVARGEKEVVRLRDGKIIAPHKHPLRQMDKPLGTFFETLVKGLKEPETGDAIISSFKVEREQLLDIYMMAIARILERIRSERHGGSVVISASPLSRRVAYRTYTVIGHAALADDILNHCRALRGLQAAPIDPSSEAERFRAEAAVRQSSQSLIRGVNRVSLLAAIDGAVLLDGKLRIEGFGVRFPVLLPPDTTILDALTGIEYPCDEWGLRHQSVFSVCQKCDEAVGFVISQDGSVKAVKSVQGRLHFWDGILD
ncbi:putative sensor domain DACNV-containing protein [Rubinisphaera brasiliensis]|uniref:Probable sensor domain-containing protein n=1 Tax=Rubinisphaera brasiliensis (strain ATCC 49424 / DSM 5305 / JCM 21570 / IAM 15109 / NBRC 103401 / IFAM 1448) TaxID=756272 RepID=F0SQS4_RUBBR|nr:hypothetical protein [Rubinisphaera brasiliensis]ADY59104.1 hypothetical protein Plabr_1493 [Rubinisphaera brasiliensis DSM 5305]